MAGKKLEDVCPICISDLDVEDSIFSLECGHMYCKGCIEELVTYCERNGKVARCPLCQKDISYNIDEISKDDIEEGDNCKCCCISIRGISKTLTCIMMGIIGVYVFTFIRYRNEV